MKQTEIKTTFKGQTLRSNLNQAIFDYSSFGIKTFSNSKEINRLRAYIRKKIKELEDLELTQEDFLVKEQKEFLIKKGIIR